MDWLFHNYKFNLQELTAYKNKLQIREIKEIQKYNEEKVIQLGPDLAAAEIILRIGGRVKFVDDDIWYRRFEDGTYPIPRQYEEGFHVQGIDVSNIVLFYLALDNFSNLEHVRFINFSRSKYVDDWYIERVLELCPDIEALDISYCSNITDNGLEMLHKFENLKVVNVTNCPKIKRGEAICAQLEELNPELSVIGLDTLQTFKTSEELHDYEQRTSRYLNWGYILNTRLGLKNDINFDKFFETKVEKAFSDSDSAQSAEEIRSDKDTVVDEDKDHSHSSSENKISEGMNG